MSTPWTREKQSKRAKEWWAKMSPEEREARRVLRQQAFRRRHPERAAAHDQAMLDPQPCHTCGAQAWPFFGKLPSNEILGWRCREHWPNRKPPPGEPGEGAVSAGELLD